MLVDTVFVDLDGVCADQHSVWTDMYNADYDDDLRSSDVTRWEIHEFVKPECGKKIYEYLDRPDFYDNVKAIPGALTGVTQLHEGGFKVVFLTSGIFPSKAQWLYRVGSSMIGARKCRARS